MSIRLCLSLLLTVCAATATAAEIKFSECRGAHGERVFSDSPDCASASVREWSLPLPAIAPTPAAKRKDQPATRRQGSSNRRARTKSAPESYLCSAGGRSWYQHSACRSSGEKGESVRQTRVPRQQACREIARPAAALRGGNERDERAGPYARATGRDPCR
jgi:hypothetical protein